MVAIKWKDIIVNGWPVGYSPKIFGINPKQDKGKVKKLKKIHAKMIIIDDKECLITSANLTENAMETNVEAGVWTRDKKIVEDSCKLGCKSPKAVFFRSEYLAL